MMIRGIHQPAGPVAPTKTGAVEAAFNGAAEFLMLMAAPAKADGEGGPLKPAILSARIQGESGLDSDLEVETLPDPDTQNFGPFDPVSVKELASPLPEPGAQFLTDAPIVAESLETPGVMSDRAQAEPVVVDLEAAKPAPVTFIEARMAVPQSDPPSWGVVARSQGQPPEGDLSPSRPLQAQPHKASPGMVDLAAPMQTEPSVSTLDQPERDLAIASAPGPSLGEPPLPQEGDDAPSGRDIAGMAPIARPAAAPQGLGHVPTAPQTVRVGPIAPQIETLSDRISASQCVDLPTDATEPETRHPIAQGVPRAQLPEIKNGHGSALQGVARLLPVREHALGLDTEKESAASVPAAMQPVARISQTPADQVDIVRLAEWRITGLAIGRVQERRPDAAQRPEVSTPSPAAMSIEPFDNRFPAVSPLMASVPAGVHAGIANAAQPEPKVPLQQPNPSADPATGLAPAENVGEGHPLSEDLVLPTVRPVARPDGPQAAGMGAPPNPLATEAKGPRPATPEQTPRPARAMDAVQTDQPTPPDPDQRLAPLSLPTLPAQGEPLPHPRHDPAVASGVIATAYAPVATVLPEGRALPPVSPVAVPDIGHQIVQAVTLAPDGPVEVTLAPEELGRVQIRLVHDGDTMRVTFLTERPDTMDLLRRHADTLSQGFRDLGYGGTTFQFGQGGAQAGDRPQMPDPVPERPAAPRLAVDPPIPRQTAEATRAVDAQTKLDLRL